MKLANPILGKHFDTVSYEALALCIHRGYAVANAVCEHDIFRWKVGTDLYPYIKNVAVQHEVKKLVEKGFMGMKYKTEQNNQKNCNHLEANNDDIVLTISQVNIVGSTPRHAIYRARHCYGNQITMFDVLGLEDVYSKPENKYYCILTYGNSTFEKSVPQYIYLGIPKMSEKGWIELINLSDIRRAETGDNPILTAQNLGIELRDIEEFEKTL